MGREIGWPAKDEVLNWQTLAKAHQRLGELSYSSNRLEEAMEQFRQADAIAERLATSAPDDIDPQMQLAKSRRRFGVIALSKLGDTEGGRRYLRQVLEIHRACLTKRPGDDDLKNELAHSLGQLAAAELLLGHLREARGLYLEEVRVRESFTPARAGQLEIRRELAGLHEKLGELYFRMSAPEEARRSYDRCADLRQQVLSERPDFWPAINDLAMTYNNAGMVRFPQGRDPAAARPFHSKAVALYTKRSDDDPADQDVKARLATTLYYEATCALHSGDAAGADAGYRRCLEIRRALATDPKFKAPQLDLMVALARCGQHAEAARIARALVEIPPKDEDLYFQAACGYALAAGAARSEGQALWAAIGSLRSAIVAGLDAGLARLYTDRALDCLRQGKARGWADVVSLEIDPDLDPIRDHPALRALLAEFRRPVGAGR